VPALAVAAGAVDHHQRHGSAKARAPARIQPVPERSRSPKRIAKEHHGSNPRSSTIQSGQTDPVSGFEETVVISMTWSNEMRSAVEI